MIEKFTDYTEFLNQWILSQPKKGYGQKTKMAEFLDMQGSHMSQILSGTLPLKEEHAILLAQYVGLTPLETDYFLTLVAEARAGNKNLKDYHQAKAKTYRQQLKEILNKEDDPKQANLDTYFSSWVYAGVHIYLALGPKSLAQLVDHLHLPKDQLERVVEDLLSLGYLRKKDGLLYHSEADITLSKGHPLLQAHHLNWRIRALDQVQNIKESNLHFTSVISCSKADAEEFKDRIRQCIKDLRASTKESENNLACCYTFDFFDVF